MDSNLYSVEYRHNVTNLGENIPFDETAIVFLRYFVYRSLTASLKPLFSLVHIKFLLTLVASTVFTIYAQPSLYFASSLYTTTVSNKVKIIWV